MSKLLIPILAVSLITFTACQKKSNSLSQQKSENDSSNVELEKKSADIESVEFHAMKAVGINDLKGKDIKFLSFAKAFTKAWKNANPDEVAREKCFISTVELGQNGGWTDKWKSSNEAYECILEPNNGYLYMHSGADQGIDYQISYWKRTDGKYLLGINRLVWHETDKMQADSSQVAFYLYDPATDKCTYDKTSVDAVLTSISNVIEKYGKPAYDATSRTSTSYRLLMPRQGKDIDFHCRVDSPIGPGGAYLKSEKPKVTNHNYIIKWNGLSFDVITSASL